MFLGVVDELLGKGDKCREEPWQSRITKHAKILTALGQPMAGIWIMCFLSMDV